MLEFICGGAAALPHHLSEAVSFKSQENQKSENVCF
jgi:hypothetical protein